MIEIEQRIALAHLQQHTGELAAAGGIEINQITDGIDLIGIGVGTQRGQRHSLQQFRIARAEGLASRQLETGMRALGQAQQARF